MSMPIWRYLGAFGRKNLNWMGWWGYAKLQEFSILWCAGAPGGGPDTANLAPKWQQNGAKMEPTWHQNGAKWSQHGAKFRKKSIQKSNATKKGAELHRLPPFWPKKWPT